MSESELTSVTPSAIPVEITAEGENYLNTVFNFSKYAPQPPPDIIRKDEAGPDWDRPYNEGPVAIFRRAAPYEFNDYKGGIGPYMRDTNAKPISQKYVSAGEESGLRNNLELILNKQLGPIHSTIMLTDIIKNDRWGLSIWAYAYLLGDKNISLYWKIRYLIQIANNDVEYPSDLQKIIISTIDELSNRSFNNVLTVIAQKSYQLKFYIPRNLLMPELQFTHSERKQITPLEIFFFSNIYWLRYFRPERPRLTSFLNYFTMIDLYLVTANPFERYPGRKLLSYYNDEDLYLKFGRLGNFFFTKTYSSKQIQLDGLVGMSLQPFGYFIIENWTRPIRVTYCYSSIPLSAEKIQTFDLDVLVNSQLKINDLPINSLLPFLRLAIQVESSWPIITDKEAWMPFLNLVNGNADIFWREYLKLKSVSLTNISTHTFIQLPDKFESLEQKYTTCLLCEQVRPSGDFSLCGHGTCTTCQALLNTSKCPFCSEHFVADNINDEFVRVLQSNFSENYRTLLQEKIQKILNLKRDRSFKFDWANGDIRLFTGR
jgi:hypothetical protein